MVQFYINWLRLIFKFPPFLFGILMDGNEFEANNEKLTNIQGQKWA